MVELIDKSAVKEQLKRHRPLNGEDASNDRIRYITWLGIYHALNDLPTVDIVRCKDCKFNYGNEHNCSFNPNDIICTYWESDGLQSDDFCSYGERVTERSK